MQAARNCRREHPSSAPAAARWRRSSTSVGSTSRQISMRGVAFPSHQGKDSRLEMVTQGNALKRLGRYELLEKIATGGMAEIYLACERGVRGLERLVVIKRILPHLAAQNSFVEMFV